MRIKLGRGSTNLLILAWVTMTVFTVTTRATATTTALTILAAHAAGRTLAALGLDMCPRDDLARMMDPIAQVVCDGAISDFLHD